jgi:hypothetical protein
VNRSKNMARETEYDIINKYIDEAISLILKKKEYDCIRVLESLKLFSHSVLNAKYLFGTDED